MKLKLTKRDMQFFFLGVLAMLIVTLAYDWKDFKAGLIGALPTQTEIAK
ncbi:MAG: hypothetical protein WC384_17820 [Prolixibacteraceae bacterium]|jgi:hypothetical protein